MKNSNNNKIKCPACGKLNSKSLQNCQECGITLKFVKGDDLVGVSEKELEAYKKRITAIKDTLSKAKKNDDRKPNSKKQNIAIEKVKPDHYGEKDPFETEDEYLKRNLGYGYVKVGNFELNNKDYNIDKKRFKIKSKYPPINLNLKREEKKYFYRYIDIDPKEAKKLFSDNNRNIYSKFIEKNGDIEKEYYILFNNSTYLIKMTDNEIKEKKQIKFILLGLLILSIFIAGSIFPNQVAEIITTFTSLIFGIVFYGSIIYFIISIYKKPRNTK